MDLSGDTYGNIVYVSMKSGLEGRNNQAWTFEFDHDVPVSMKSGLEGRNNSRSGRGPWLVAGGLNEVRPRRPEQSDRPGPHRHRGQHRLNEVRPRRPEQFSPIWKSERSPALLSQ